MRAAHVFVGPYRAAAAVVLRGTHAHTTHVAANVVRTTPKSAPSCKNEKTTSRMMTLTKVAFCSAAAARSQTCSVRVVREGAASLRACLLLLALERPRARDNLVDRHVAVSVKVVLAKRGGQVFGKAVQVQQNGILLVESHANT